MREQRSACQPESQHEQALVLLPLSETSTLVSEAHFAYIAARTRDDDEFMTRLKAAARAAGIPPIWIAPEQASFLQILLKLARARKVVEVGTLAGCSAIAMARALPSRDDIIENLVGDAGFEPATR